MTKIEITDIITLAVCVIVFLGVFAYAIKIKKGDES